MISHLVILPILNTTRGLAIDDVSRGIAEIEAVI